MLAMIPLKIIQKTGGLKEAVEKNILKQGND